MKISTLFKPAALLLGAGLVLYSSYGLAAKCEYVVQSDWNSGFVAAIRITNDSTTAINGWSVNWAYTDGSRRTGGWNANVSGNNPYSASGVGWNDRINPGQTVEFGIQGSKGTANSPAQRPVVTGSVCEAPRTSVSSSSRSASSSSRMTSSSSSITTSRSSSSSSSVSSGPNTPPIAVLETTAHGLTVQASARDSRDADGHSLQYTIDFGDGTLIKYPEAWHTYKEAGDYTVTVRVSDGFTEDVETSVVSVQPTPGNVAPIARLTVTFSYGRVAGHAQTSYDEEGSPLIYEWDLGDGPFIGTANAAVNVCGSSSSRSASSSPYGANNKSALLTLTVSDGVLKNTIQRGAGGQCQYVYDLLPHAEFTYSIEGNTLTVDGSPSRDETGFSWDFGDGTTATGLKASHTYAAPGTYNVRLHLSGPTLFSNSITKAVVIGGSDGSSTATASSSSRSYSSSITSSSVASSSVPHTSMGSSSSATSTVPNTRPVAALDVVVHGMTVFIDGRQSTDAEGPLNYKIYTGDPSRPTIFYPYVWNTYATPGEYSIALEVWDSVGASHVVSKKITVQPVAGNQAPIAMLTAVREYNARIGHASASFDPEGTPLTYEWDFGNGVFAGDARASFTDCVGGQSSVYTGYVTVTVSDGELKDTRQKYVSGRCGTVIDILPQPVIIYHLEGNTIFADGRLSRDVTGLSWDFGDGSPKVSGLLAQHTYAAAGTYTVELSGAGPSLFSNRTSQTVVVGSASSASSYRSSSPGILSSSGTGSSAAGL